MYAIRTLNWKSAKGNLRNPQTHETDQPWLKKSYNQLENTSKKIKAKPNTLKCMLSGNTVPRRKFTAPDT